MEFAMLYSPNVEPTPEEALLFNYNLIHNSKNIFRNIIT